MKPGILHKHAQELKIIYSKYEQLHQQGFQTLWWRSMPIPFLFKPINFEKLSTELGKLSSIMDKKIAEIQLLAEDKSATDIEFRFAQGLLKYCESINISINLLQKICRRLFEKSKGSRGELYSMSDYKSDLNTYHESVKTQKGFGYALNNLYAELGMNDWKREREDEQKTF